MNILPLVLSFILIFGCLCATFLKELKSSYVIENALCGYYRAEKALKNGIVKKEYEKIKTDPSASTPTPKTAPKKKTALRRDQFPPLEISKFYFRALSAGASSSALASQHPLYEPLARLIHELYHRPLFSKHPKLEHPEYALLNAMLAKANKKPNFSSFAELHPDDPELSELYYKMLKGTNQYDGNVGIPPLHHVLSLDKNDKALFVCATSPLILNALFGKEMCSSIFAKDQAETSPTKEEWEAFFTQELSTNTALSSLLPCLNYKRPRAKQEQIAKKDPMTGITLERTL